MSKTTAAKFTPGPWTVHRMATGRPYVQLGRDQRSGDGSCDVHGLHAHENARLIAQAPAMFDALRALVNVDDGPLDGPLDYMDKVEKVVARVRAILAAVEGEG